MRLAAQSDFFVKSFGPEEGFRKLKSIGYEAVTFAIRDRYDEPFTTSWTEDQIKERFSAIGAAAKAQGLEIIYATNTCDIYNDLLVHTFDARKEMCLRIVRAAHYMGAKSVAFRPVKFNGNIENANEASKQLSFEIFDLIKKEADKYSLPLAFFNNIRGGKKYCFGCTAEELKELCARYGAKAVIDPVNAYKAQERLDRLTEGLKGQIFGIVLDDVESTIKNPFMPMMGSIDYSVILKCAAEAPDDSFAIMDCSGVFNRYSEFADHKGVVEALNTLLYDMGRAVVAKK
ncbi:MAG: TIM barrel protein [Clostridia bacterium]|nr:TIM barrel protein [Clostridia bacterium]